MRKEIRLSNFTDEEMAILKANPFTSKVDRRRIWFTLEFQNLFLSRYEAGDTATEIFTDLGYDISILGPNRVYGFPRRLYDRIGSGRELTEVHSPHNATVQKPVNVDYNTMPSQTAVSSMQRELTYLRQQVEFLKKITELDKGQK